jgi:hypothetical protein
MNKLWFISYLTSMCDRTLNTEEIGVIEHQLSLMVSDSAARVQCSVVDDLLKVMGVEGKKIEAIKAYRILTGTGLKESKDAVEKYWPQPVNDPRQGKPEYSCRFMELTGDRRLRVESYVNGPRWGIGEIIYTSEVGLIDFDKGYAVTHNSVYRWK